jgi:hypothetical protein
MPNAREMMTTPAPMIHLRIESSRKFGGLLSQIPTTTLTLGYVDLMKTRWNYRKRVELIGKIAGKKTLEFAERPSRTCGARCF